MANMPLEKQRWRCAYHCAGCNIWLICTYRNYEYNSKEYGSSDHLVDATLPATEVKSSELSIRNGETKTSVASGNEHVGEKQLTDVLVNW
ncbi:unnamed protein product [Prunus armeniaca]